MRTIHFLLAAVISLLASIHPAMADDWQFRYTGFYDTQSDFFNPTFYIGGTFSATDANHDNRIEQYELTDFTINGYLWGINCSEFRECGLTSFSYIPGTRQLAFDAGQMKADDGMVIWFSEIHTGSTALTRMTVGFHEVSRIQVNWTDQTVLTVTGPPVPEPETYAMLLAGLGLLGGAALRRKSR
ncbi:PEP-CTERM sorting domain-containing protein [Duganella vulcania]|uniref:PEP-CTERM sorting domain-containing protein n=1 Tax=Duganella vulcania TaxID=2692166 RepID=UPI0020C47D63|nr:PEP-CTERM sorting domain-containing protein [Duganella vulcania]